MLSVAELVALNDCSTGEAAGSYAEAGLPVFPTAGIVSGHCGCWRRSACPHPGKHPLVPGGLHAATDDQGQVASWWRRWPWAGIGLATGQRSGLVVIDIDPAHGGIISLKVLDDHHLELSATLVAATGGGGWHLFYSHPGGRIANAVGELPEAGSAPGIDVRGDGGYVQVAPSPHASGHRYAWSSATELVHLPSWLKQASRPTAFQHRGRPVLSAAPDRYLRAAVAHEVVRVANAEEGARNDSLVRAAFSLGTLVGSGILEPDQVRQALVPAALQAGLGQREAELTVASGLRAGETHPRLVVSAGAHRQTMTARRSLSLRVPT